MSTLAPGVFATSSTGAGDALVDFIAHSALGAVVRSFVYDLGPAWLVPVALVAGFALLRRARARH